MAVLLTSLCLWAGTEGEVYASRSGSDLDDISYTAGDMLERNLLYYLDRTLPILSTSFVNLDNLKETSAFGRLVGVQIASRFSQHGYRVIDIRLSNGKVLVQERNGELVLSRDMKRINNRQDAQAILVGTYTIAGNRAFVSTRLVSTLDNAILSSYNFSIKMDDLLKALAQKNLNSAAVSKKQVPKRAKGANRNSISAIKKDSVSSGTIFLELSNPLAAKIVQSHLYRLGYYTAKVDGKWGKKSRAALVSFKKARKLPNVNRWDMGTQMVLLSAQR
jgi:TolB-like protein